MITKLAEKFVREKVAFALTPEGHEYDKQVYDASSKMWDGVADAKEQYMKKAPIRSAFRGTTPVGERILANRARYVADRHGAERNAYNPFAGWTRKSVERNRARLSGK